MPYYGIPVGQTSEDVAFAFNKDIITGMLRDQYGFDGVICSDWGLVSPAKMLGILEFSDARAWGVEHMDRHQLVEKMLDAGIDQFGGEHVPELVIDLVEEGRVAEARIDQSVRRLLRDKFRLGLFDNPYVDLDAVDAVVGQQAFIDAGVEAQRRSLVLLGNNGSTLPLSGKPRIYIENIDPAIAGNYGVVVATPGEADVAIIRVAAPYEPREGVLDSFFHAGDLDFKGEEKERILALLDEVPTVVDIYLDRAAVIPEIADRSAALIANFGASDEVLLDAVFGKFSPTGKLPFEMPSSLNAVRDQLEDVPYDSEAPLFPFGHGLTYSRSGEALAD